MKTLMDVHTLQERLTSRTRTIVLDVRWALGDFRGRQHYLEAHIPGAVYVDLESQLAAPASAAEGRHPLPAIGHLQESARSWGVDNDDVVVAYDDSGNLSAARLWWLLRYAGFQSVYLLDGGLGAWTAAGYGVVEGSEQLRPGNVTLDGAGAMPVAGIDDVARFARSGVLLDARAGERYRGEIEPVDPKAGHIPGALSAPAVGNLLKSGTFKSAAELRRRFEALGVDGSAGVAVYCGSGVTAAHDVAALEIAGFRAALYPGSWSQWSARAELPVATGGD